MEISEHIYQNLNFRISKNELSSIFDLEGFFSQFSSETIKEWPLISKGGDKVLYQTALVCPHHLGLSESLRVVADIKRGESSFKVAESINVFEGMEIEIDSLIRTEGSGGNSVIFDLISKHRKFLHAYDRENGLDSESALLLKACSGKAGDVVTSGGYVWAIQGFDFYDTMEREAAQAAFAQYAVSKGVVINHKDLRLFKKPCHFAAFQCGVKVDGKHLGKAFLLQYSWRGKMTVPQKGKDSEEYRFAKTYNQYRGNGNYLAVAVGELSKSYLQMMKKYHLKYSKSSNNVSLLGRLRKKIRVFG